MYTTSFHSFTDRTIPLVCDSEFVGNFFTDDIPDGNRPSTFLSSVIPNSVATLVGKKKTIANSFTDENCAPKKKISRLKYIDGLIPSVIVAYPVNIFQLSVKCRRTIALGNFIGECVKYQQNISVCKFVDDCGICTKLL